MHGTDLQTSGWLPEFFVSSLLSSAAGVELSKKALVNVSSFDVWSPWSDTNSESGNETSQNCLTVNEILTVLSVFGPAWRWCDLNGTSSPWSAWPVASPLAELCEPSPNEHGRIVPPLALSAIPSSADENSQWVDSPRKHQNPIAESNPLCLFFLHLVFLELNDLLQSFWGGCSLSSETWYSHPGRGGFG